MTLLVIRSIENEAITAKLADFRTSKDLIVGLWHTSLINFWINAVHVQCTTRIYSPAWRV